MREITTINNERMAAFIATIVKQTQVILHERAEDILKAWHENMEEATANEDKLPEFEAEPQPEPEQAVVTLDEMPLADWGDEPAK